MATVGYFPDACDPLYATSSASLYACHTNSSPPAASSSSHVTLSAPRCVSFSLAFASEGNALGSTALFVISPNALKANVNEALGVAATQDSTVLHDGMA